MESITAFPKLVATRNLPNRDTITPFFRNPSLFSLQKPTFGSLPVSSEVWNLADHFAWFSSADSAEGTWVCKDVECTKKFVKTPSSISTARQRGTGPG